jgi:betaine reductase
MRVIHYLNQFFGGIGGEERADLPPAVLAGPVGPGTALGRLLGHEARIVATVVCGDGRFADAPEETARAVLALLEPLAPDALVAGPAFGAGRYGLACARVCLEVERRLGRPAVAGMHPESAAVDLYRRDVVIVPTAASAAGMGDALARMAPLLLRRARGESLGPAASDGYLPRGPRLNGRVEGSASARATVMLLARLRGAPFATEVPLPRYDRVAPPAPLPDLGRARLALVSECGAVPPGNPDRLEWVRASKWLRYPLPSGRGLAPGEVEVAHGGYDAALALADPNRLLPVDALRQLERERAVGDVLARYYVTCGNHGILEHMARYAREIAADLRRQHVDGVLLVAT